MDKQFLDFTGLDKLLGLFKGLYDNIFNSVNAAKEDPRIFNIDYSELEFDTDLIISGGASSSTIDVGQVGFMIIAES